MPNAENIVCQSKEKMRENGLKGAAITNAKRRQKKMWRDELQLMMSLPISRAEKGKVTKEANKLLSIEKAKAIKDFSGKNTTVQTQILLKLTQMAMGGNLKAMEFIATLTGDYKQQVDITSSSDVKITNKVDDLADNLFGDDD